MTDDVPSKSAPSERQTVPQRIGRYRVERMLGQGGFGVVYLAYDERLQRLVAIKVPQARRLTHPGDAAAYLAEAHMVARLDHPNIVPVYDAGSTDSIPVYIVTKYINGASLSDWMRVNRASSDEAAQLVATVADALHYAHRQGLVHRDVKPGNVLIDQTGTPFLVDFGQALSEQRLGGEDEFVGTPAYMSPEQARGEGHRVDARSDVFSLGVVFYELLTGRRPFIGDSQKELLAQVCSADPVPPRQIEPAIPKELERICIKALAKRASERYATAKDFADDLRHWIAPGQYTDVFLSHASQDGEVANKLCALIEAQGVRCWIAPRDILPGENYAEAIVRAIEASAVTVLLLSQHSNASIHVIHEVERATSKRKTVVPIRIENVIPDRALELHLSTAQWIDCNPRDPGEAANQLVRVAKRLKEKSAVAAPPPGSAQSSDPLSSTIGLPRIVPKGLRSFDAHDSDFFLELLPGPRDRDGLPDSIRFWKLKIEERDPARTFAVGLIYGPSGCGKSSLMKAGLLPRLSDDVFAVYVEASATRETEARVLNGLRRRCPDLPADVDLKGAVAALRQGQALPEGAKVVIVLDQFEQWLHAEKDGHDGALVEALRQCDGGRVQCIIMVRDDFWLAVSRFLRELEIRLVEGENSALVDLFDIDHARKVLIAFGRAFGRLPERSADMNAEAAEFLRLALEGLAEEGKVISVRLALFAEMMKSRPWTPAALKEVGGTAGVGVTFLEETFAASTAAPERRYHQRAARAVLNSLLPESGSDIKGHMRSAAELLEASGYAERRRDFDDLIRILDNDLRLLTPTDPEGNVDADDEDATPSRHGHHFYQLTHDYLVPALREWLTRKLKETRRGRAELLLADRAGIWNARRENRQLPSFAQWLRIRLLTDADRWTPQQRRMMTRATRFHALRGGALAACVAVAVAAGLWIEDTISQRERATAAAGLVNELLSADTTYVPAISAEMVPYRQWVDPLLRQDMTTAPDGSRQKLNAGLVLLPEDATLVDFLFGRLLTAEPTEVPVIVQALKPHQAALVDRLWAMVAAPAKGEEAVRLRAAAALAVYAPDDRAHWTQNNAAVIHDLVHENPIFLGQWSEAFRPVRDQLLAPLEAVYRDSRPENSAERSLATNLLADYAADEPLVLTDLLMDADQHQFAIILSKLEKTAQQALPLLNAELDKVPRPDADEAAKESAAKRQANAAVALLKLNAASKVWPLLKFGPDPRARSYLIQGLSVLQVDPKSVVDRLAAETDVSIRRALILSLGGFDDTALANDQRQALTAKLDALYRDDPDPGLHAAAEWLLRQWKNEAWLDSTDAQMATDAAGRARKVAALGQALVGAAKPDSAWYVNAEGEIMVVLPGPSEFTMGSPPSEAYREVNEVQHRVRIPRTIALAEKPITLEQYRQFDPSYRVLPTFSRMPDMPVIAVSWYDAAAFCNWLSKMEHIPEDQWIYEISNGVVTRMKPNYLELRGYRLPTEAELEYAMRAGTVTSRYYGETADLLDRYAWYNADSGDLTWPVGTKMPNDFGFFDMLGGVWSWSQDELLPYANGAVDDKEQPDLAVQATASRVLRGGSFNYEAKYIRSAYRYNYTPNNRNQHYGFRVVKTMTAADFSAAAAAGAN